MGALFDSLLLSPDIVYLTVVLGLWLGVTSAYVPGTGLAELGAVGLLIVGIAALVSLPTNWLAFALLVIGIGAYLVLPFFDEKYARLADIGLIFQAAGSYFLFEGITISPVLIVATVIVGFAYNQWVLRPTMRTLRQPSESDEANEVLGKRGRVVKDLNPVGTVYVNREHWRARSDENLAKDTPVDVVGQEGLELIVEKAKRETAPQYDYDAQDALIHNHTNGNHNN